MVRTYEPVQTHWFYQTKTDKPDWQPFSRIDSSTLEKAYQSNRLELIATDGGRYDVSIPNRQRTPVYWKGDPSEVQRCSWFYKCIKQNRFLPYDEIVAIVLEQEFKISIETNKWDRKIKLETGETVVIQAPDIIVFFHPSESPDNWDNPSNQLRPRPVKRGISDFQIEEGEPVEIDHVLFMVHGIGSVCDLKFKPVEETVDDFRSIAFNLVQAHYKSSYQKGNAHRVEVLPISWHQHLHSDETGIDNRLKKITLESIPKLREFTNDTIVDVLFYTSPVYSQTIISAVTGELNRIYEIFIQRNPNFKGGVSLGGHSLGSLILFDLLCHQHSHDNLDSSKDQDSFKATEEQVKPSDGKIPRRKLSRRISYMMGAIGTGQPQIDYPHLLFEPHILFALGSPIGMFTIVRGLDTLGENFALPTCPRFYNIFHPYDPIAYRIESLIHPDLGNLKPVLIPHHKGRKRMHLELKDTTTRLGADIKEKVVGFVNTAWNSFNLFTNHYYKQDDMSSQKEDETENECGSETEWASQSAPPTGHLNNGKRVDYVLQEAPFEFFNEYLFALHSHVCYWESSDTILFMLREIYDSSMGILPDSQIPQQSMTVERLSISSVSSPINKLKPIPDIEEKE